MRLTPEQEKEIRETMYGQSGLSEVTDLVDEIDALRGELNGLSHSHASNKEQLCIVSQERDLLKAALEVANVRIRNLFENIKHGDAEHQLWLKNKIAEHFKITTDDVDASGFAASQKERKLANEKISFFFSTYS